MIDDRVEEPDDMSIRLRRGKQDKALKLQPRMRNRGPMGSGDTWPEEQLTALDKGGTRSLTEEGSV